jgi:quaternary ammonium compound-resistance protein SugE
MAWLALLVAGLFEVLWALSLKQSQGFTRLGPSVLTLVALAASLFLLALSLRTLPLGVAYAVWTGIGAIGAFIAGVVLWHEPLSAARVLALALLVAGLGLLKWSHATGE